ncbi:MAG: type I-E CRISPR-associated protein Cse2/CasB [Candidatus Scalindua sp.]
MSVNITEKAKRLIKSLEKRKEDRGVMADLKRGFSETTEDRSWPYISQWGCNIVKNNERLVYQTVSAAYAYSKGNTGEGNMGTVCRNLAMGSSQGKKGLASFEARFRRLLTCSSVNELSGHLVGIIRAAAAKNIAINFEQLFSDLWWWSYSDKSKLQWASEYWKTEEE